MTDHVRSESDPEALAGMLRDDLRELDAGLPLSSFDRMVDLVEASVADQRFFMRLTSGFAALALVLAAVLSLLLVSGLILAFFGLAAGWRPARWRVGLLLAYDGVGNGRQIVPADWVRDTYTSEANMQDEERKRIFPNGGYRNQVWLRDVDTRVMMARGVFGQLIYADPDKELVVVLLSSWPEFTSIDRSATVLNLIDAIAAEIGA